MLCQSCDKPKLNLFPKKSTLVTSVNLILCQSCIDQKLEPRWIVILAGRHYGSEYVKPFILNRRYIGKDITASELMTQ